MPAAAALPIAGAAMGGTGGAIAGARGSRTYQETVLPQAGPEERELQRQAIEQYLQQRNLIDQQQGGLSSLDPLRNASLQGLQGITSGQAFQSTPEELANINAIRQAQIQLGTQDFGQQFQDMSNRTNASAGVRGLRGQALGSLHGQNMRTMGQQIGNIVKSAGLQASQQAMENPYRRVAAQTPVFQMGATYQDQLRQQAIQNRQLASNPALMDYFQRQRIAAPRVNNVTPGGGFWGAVQGNMLGSMGGLSAGTSAQSGPLGSMIGGGGGA